MSTRSQRLRSSIYLSKKVGIAATHVVVRDLSQCMSDVHSVSFAAMERFGADERLRSTENVDEDPERLMLMDLPLRLCCI